MMRLPPADAEVAPVPAAPADGMPSWLLPLVSGTAGRAGSAFSSFTAPSDARPRAASVLVLFGGEDEATSEGRYVVLLERSTELRSHPGQVAFPGGARDPGDPDDVSTALREAHEETGLDPAGVSVLAVLPRLWLPPSNFEVTPVLGWWHSPSPVSAVDPAETRSVHTVRLDDLLDPLNRVTVRHPSGYLGPAFTVGDLLVWGFTAGLMSRLFVLAGWELPWDSTRVVALPQLLLDTSTGNSPSDGRLP